MAFDLEALDGLRLIGADGQAVQAQRRRLALLALLAAAGERGLTRDQLVGCLWPETTDDNARHALNQLLYGIRRSVSEDALGGADPLHLNPEVVDSDVRRFETALAAGDDTAAVAQYRGPFLNGFYLPDAPAFERRVETERARLAAGHADALERLAVDAERRGDSAAAVGLRRTLAELDRLDARRAAAMMRALAAAGDSTGAVVYGRTYEALVRSELDAPADPAVIALASEILSGCRRGGRADSASAQAIEDEQDNTFEGSEAQPIAVSGRRRNHSRRILAYGVGAAVLVVALFGARRLGDNRSVGAEAATTSGPSIAILPLTNLSADPADAVLADGMTEELISMLSRVGNLRVVPSTSVFALRGERMDVRQIADSLHVNHVLEGGFQKVGHTLRMRVRLIDARDNTTRWSEKYDRDIGDIFAVQDDIAHAVTREIDVRLAGGDNGRSATRRYTPSVEAYEWYLRGMDQSLTRSKDGRQKALGFFDRAIAADSSFAAAYAGLVRIYVLDAGDAPGDQQGWFARAEGAALKAVALDDSLPEAHVGLGWARNVQKNFPAAEAEFRHAIALDPRAPRAHEGLARVYLWTGRNAEALKAARFGLEVDPFSHTGMRELGHALLMNDRCDEAIDLLRPLKALSPPAGVAGVIIGQCYASKQMWPEAIAEFRWAMNTEGPRAAVAFLGYALARAGRRAEADSILSDLLAGRTYSHGAFGIATVYTGLRNYDAALTWLDKSVDEQSVRVYIIGPMFDELRGDPRFARIKKRIGL